MTIREIADQVKETAVKLPTAKAVIGAVILIASVSVGGYEIVRSQLIAPSTVEALVPRVERVERALQDTIKDRLDAVEAGLSSVDSTLDYRLSILRSIEATLDTLRGSTSGIECVVLLELPPRTCLARNRRTP